MGNTDIYGRIESFDQSMRGLNRRLRAVERRLSSDGNGRYNYQPDDLIGTADQWTDPDIEEFRSELQEFHNLIQTVANDLTILRRDRMDSLQKAVDSMEHDVHECIERIDELASLQNSFKEDAMTSMNFFQNSYRSELRAFKDELGVVRQQLDRQQNLNKITIGSIKVPVELSGIVASLTLAVTGFLVWTDRWDIIRSFIYPTGLAALFAAVVVIKFVMANRQTDNS